ncbi:MAG TPA: isoprenylcysteine carboxylmethyltransferase family protein [Anaerolineales bacterium]|nr:isoprenylcysteine carboxylmethyltransferase family protein [Anaerolineales bacterium]
MEIKLALFTLIFLFFVVRAYHHRKAETEGGKIEYREKNLKAIRLMRGVGGIVFLSAFASYFVAPQWVSWAAIPLPGWLRWAGLALGYANLPLLWWIEATLGKNFNTTLHLREGHTLVTTGPYRWVRHPMYTSLFIFTIALLLASANWLIGLPLVLSLIVIVVNRIDREEALMMEQFGDEYREYMKRTGRLLPRLGR